MITPNSQYLTWFRDIEKSLFSFYRLFDNLCQQCAINTLKSVETNSRDNRKSWCCCMIDNQVNDNWEILNAIQCKFDNGWYEKLKKNEFNLGKCRMPGNGPCPALGNNGCLLVKLRPITCTTQLCEKMLIVLHRLNIIQKFKSVPLQIEDISALPTILPVLYGLKKDKKVELKDVEEYVKRIKDLSVKFGSIDLNTRKQTIDKVIKEYWSEN